MSKTFRALQVPLGEDLLPLTALLRSRGVLHQIYEESGQQVLSVFDPSDVQPVENLYRAWRSGDVQIEARAGRPVASTVAPASNGGCAPVTVGLRPAISIAVVSWPFSCSVVTAQQWCALLSVPALR